MTNKKVKRVNVYLTPEMYETCKADAQAQGVSLSAYFILAVGEYIKMNNLDYLEQMKEHFEIQQEKIQERLANLEKKKK